MAFASALLAISGMSGCSTAQIDSIPKEIGGLPEGAPKRADAPPDYPAVHDMPPPRATTLLDAEQQKRIEADLIAARNRQPGQEKNTEPRKPRKRPRRKPRRSSPSGPRKGKTRLAVSRSRPAGVSRGSCGRTRRAPAAADAAGLAGAGRSRARWRRPQPVIKAVGSPAGPLSTAALMPAQGSLRASRKLWRQGHVSMEEFYRVRRLPPYVFEQVNRAKATARNAGADIIDLGMGNPDLPAPAACDREAERDARQAAHRPLFGLQGHCRAAPRPGRLLRAPLRREAQSRHPGRRDARLQGRLRQCGAGDHGAGRRRARAQSELSDPRLRLPDGGRRDPLGSGRARSGILRGARARAACIRSRSRSR